MLKNEHEARQLRWGPVRRSFGEIVGPPKTTSTLNLLFLTVSHTSPICSGTRQPRHVKTTVRHDGAVDQQLGNNMPIEKGGGDQCLHAQVLELCNWLWAGQGSHFRPGACQKLITLPSGASGRAGCLIGCYRFSRPCLPGYPGPVPGPTLTGG